MTDAEQTQLVAAILSEFPDEAVWLTRFADIVKRESRGHPYLLRGCILDTVKHVLTASGLHHDKFALALQYYLGSISRGSVIDRAALKCQPLNDAQLGIVQDVFRGALIPVPVRLVGVKFADDPNKDVHQLLRSLVLIPNRDGVLDFATVLHRRLLVRTVFPACKSKLNTRDIDEFLCAVIGCLDPALLVDPQSMGTGGFTKETPILHQFLKAACACLPPDHLVSSEVSRIVSDDEKRVISGLYFDLIFKMFTDHAVF